MQKTCVLDIKQLQINDSGHIEGITYLFSERINRYQEYGFSRVGTQTDVIKLAMSGTYVGLVVSISSIVELLILYS